MKKYLLAIGLVAFLMTSCCDKQGNNGNCEKNCKDNKEQCDDKHHECKHGEDGKCAGKHENCQHNEGSQCGNHKGNCKHEEGKKCSGAHEGCQNQHNECSHADK